MQEIFSSLSNESVFFAAACAGLLTYLIMARVPQVVDVLLAVVLIRRDCKPVETAMARRLLAAVPPRESSSALVQVDEVGTRLAVLEPRLAAAFWRFHDPILEFCLQVPPLIGIALTLLGMARDQSLTARTALLVPTVIGVCCSIMAALMMTVARWIDLPARLPSAAYRGALIGQPAPPSKRRSFTVRSHAAPVFLPAVFVAAYADLTQGLWIRERGSPAGVTLKSEVEDERGLHEPAGDPYLDVVLSADGTVTILGTELPQGVDGLAGNVRAVVRRRIADGLPFRVPPQAGSFHYLLVSIRMDQLSMNGVAWRVKALIQRELVSNVREIHGLGVGVRFAEELLPISTEPERN